MCEVNSRAGMPLDPDQSHEGKIALPQVPADDFIKLAVPLSLHGRRVLVAVPDETLGKSREDQAALAKALGGRIATQDENRAVSEHVFRLEQRGELTLQEAALIQAYRSNYVRDEEGGRYGGGLHMYRSGVDLDDDRATRGALIVQPAPDEVGVEWSSVRLPTRGT